MSGYLTDFLKQAERLGFRFVGYDGHHHPRLYNPQTGDIYSIPATPSDWRSGMSKSSLALTAARTPGGKPLGTQRGPRRNCC